MWYVGVAVCVCARMNVCMEASVYEKVCGWLVSREQRGVRGPLHSLPRDTRRSQHLDPTYACTHIEIHRDADAQSKHTLLSSFLCLPLISLTLCLTHTSTPCIQIECTQQSQCSAVALSLM